MVEDTAVWAQHDAFLIYKDFANTFESTIPKNMHFSNGQNLKMVFKL